MQLCKLQPAHTHHVGKVGGPVQLGVCLNGVAPLVHISVDQGCNGRQLGNDVQAVLHDRLPVIQLVNALAVGCSKLAVGLHKQHQGSESNTRGWQGDSRVGWGVGRGGTVTGGGKKDHRSGSVARLEGEVTDNSVAQWQQLKQWLNGGRMRYVCLNNTGRQV